MEPTDPRGSGADLPDELLMLDDNVSTPTSSQSGGLTSAMPVASSSSVTSTATVPASTSGSAPSQLQQRPVMSSYHPHPSTSQQQQQQPQQPTGPTTAGPGGYNRVVGVNGMNKQPSVLEGLLAQGPPNTVTSQQQQQNSSAANSLANSQTSNTPQQASGENSNNNGPMNMSPYGPASVPLGQNQIASPQRPPTAPGPQTNIPVSYARYVQRD